VLRDHRLGKLLIIDKPRSPVLGVFNRHVSQITLGTEEANQFYTRVLLVASAGRRGRRGVLACRSSPVSLALVVAKLDRLARNVAFTAALLESGAEFVAVDNPHANRLTIHILAAVAEDEARRISDRTKAALTAAKRRGVKLGASRNECRNLTLESRQRGAAAASEAVKRQADEAYADLWPFFAELRPALSFQQIATVLNLRGERTRRGKAWNDVAVMRACRRPDIA
jgi:hypothetical protein